MDKIRKMINEGFNAEEIAEEIGMDECVNDYGMDEFVVGCHEDADCYNCWVNCVNKKYFKMGKLLARPVLSNGGNGINYNIGVEKDGETLLLGETVDDIFCKYIEFSTRQEAIDYINNDSRLQLEEDY